MSTNKAADGGAQPRKGPNPEHSPLAFDKFEEVLQIVVNKSAPLKKASRKQKKLSQKPWLSRELLNLIKQKTNFLKNFTRNLMEIFSKNIKNKEML